MLFILISLFLNSAEARNTCHTVNSCLVRVTNCRMPDQSIELYNNNLWGTSKFFYSLRETTICYNKHSSSSHTGTHNYEWNNIPEFVELNELRMPDTLSEVSENVKNELKKMKKCKDSRLDILDSYPKCK